MKGVIFLLGLLIVLPIKTQTKTGSIEVLVSGIQYKKAGYLWIGLYNKKESFGKLDKAIKMQYIPVNNSTLTIQFKDVNYGVYAITIFHDENSNKDIDVNFLHIPNEGYGFSNNPHLFGPPNFAKAKFSFSQDILKLTIKMCY